MLYFKRVSHLNDINLDQTLFFKGMTDLGKKGLFKIKNQYLDSSFGLRWLDIYLEEKLSKIIDFVKLSSLI